MSSLPVNFYYYLFIYSFIYLFFFSQVVLVRSSLQIVRTDGDLVFNSVRPKQIRSESKTTSRVKSLILKHLSGEEFFTNVKKVTVIDYAYTAVGRQ